MASSASPFRASAFARCRRQRIGWTAPLQRLRPAKWRGWMPRHPRLRRYSRTRRRVVMEARGRITERRLETRAYQQQQAAPPPSLEALVPAYLPAVPQDPFAPKPLVYRRTGAGALVYSRGPDGKDDGGKDLGSRVIPDSRGDIVSMKPPNKR